jgi:hypothetical protein
MYTIPVMDFFSSKQAVASRLSIRAADNRINSLKAFAPFYTASIPDMSVHKIQILSVALAVLWSAVGVSCSYDPRSCTNPAVRKEWRAFSTKEKAEWIRAVNVSIDSTPASSCRKNIRTILVLVKAAS